MKSRRDNKTNIFITDVLPDFDLKMKLTFVKDVPKLKILKGSTKRKKQLAHKVDGGWRENVHTSRDATFTRRRTLLKENYKRKYVRVNIAVVPEVSYRKQRSPPPHPRPPPPAPRPAPNCSTYPERRRKLEEKIPDVIPSPCTSKDTSVSVMSSTIWPDIQVGYWCKENEICTTRQPPLPMNVLFSSDLSQLAFGIADGKGCDKRETSVSPIHPMTKNRGDKAGQQRRKRQRRADNRRSQRKSLQNACLN